MFDFNWIWFFGGLCFSIGFGIIFIGIIRMLLK